MVLKKEIFTFDTKKIKRNLFPIKLSNAGISKKKKQNMLTQYLFLLILFNINIQKTFKKIEKNGRKDP